MNDQLIKYGIAVFILALVSFVVLKPIVGNEKAYKVVIVNASEHKINSATIMGAGQNSGKIGPIKVGRINDYVFEVNQSGSLQYTIEQNNRELTGTINPMLKKGQVGKIFVVVGEMYKVSIENEFDI